MNRQLTEAYVAALTGDLNTVCDWRVIHDREKGQQGRNLRGSVAQVYDDLVQYNQAGWGVFICINAMDGVGQTLANVQYIRTHVADLDDTLTSHDGLQRATASPLCPHIVVETSPNKYHLYWFVEFYQGNDFYTLHQKKIAQVYNGDKSIIDATRVLRVPGFYHCKGAPVLVNCYSTSNNPRYTADTISAGFAMVNVVEHFSSRKPLGDPDLKAPSFTWLVFALSLLDPNEMTRDDWMAITAAYKQSGWSFTDEITLLAEWQKWCARYSGNDHSENIKLWNSIKDSEVGWGRFERLTNIKVYLLNNSNEPPMIDHNGHVVQRGEQVAARSDIGGGSNPSMPTNLADILDTNGKKLWFKDCYFVEKEGEIFSPTGRFMNSAQFNGRYGGKEFCLKAAGAKTTDEPWKAALRSTDWQIPKVDHIRFLPEKKPFDVVTDRLGRRGLNIYMPVIPDARQGDVSIWLDHLAKVIPNTDDRKLFTDYFAHMIKYPGYKIPWAFLLQSVEGVGKSAFYEILCHSLGSMYGYSPKASELIASGSKFNAWMRAKLFIVVNEVKIDERRELIEILKPMITDAVVEIQGKGADQEMEDNCANWLFFSNFKDAVPISKSGRRWAITYSGLQTEMDLRNAGMDDAYFNRFWTWLREQGGYQAIAHWFMTYPIAKGSLPVRAPRTSSYAEALRLSRSPLEILIEDKVSIGERGFRNGYISWPMLLKAIEASNMRTKPAEHNIRGVLEMNGYYEIGMTALPIAGEDMMRPSVIFATDKNMRPEDYERMQS